MGRIVGAGHQSELFPESGVRARALSRDNLAGALDHFNDGQHNLPVCLAELLNDGGRFTFGVCHK